MLFSISPCGISIYAYIYIYRQRLINQNTTLFSLASKYLPRELLQDVRMVPQVKAKKRKRAKARMETIEEEE
jgi:hypothetical protein